MFENSRDICMENYKLDPGWYYTLPGLAWDAMLKRTGVTLELLTDIVCCSCLKTEFAEV